ncbi:MAG TPA: hypothetical protein VNS32_17150 [Flavisolibacter sp.]|nr:hypothetical protein [Flavisolibacter sp.]
MCKCWHVALEAASQEMYDLTQYPTDHYFWEFLAYATGTGGSVNYWFSSRSAVMGMEKINLFLVLKKNKPVGIIGLFFRGWHLYSTTLFA